MTRQARPRTVAVDAPDLEEGLDRVGDKILDAGHGVKGGFAAA